MQSIESKVREILNNLLDNKITNEEIGLEDRLSDFGINSSDILKLMLELERNFDIEISDDDFDFTNFETLEALVNYIEKKLNSNQ